MLLNPPIIEQAPTCPARPAAWTNEVHEAAKLHTAECFPEEAVGIVEGGQYVRLDNRSTQPQRDVFLTDTDLLRVAGAEVFFHSHPSGLGSPSQTDMAYQLQLGIPFVVIVWPLYDVFWWGDSLDRAPLIGRGFRHGIHDCMSLIRDWHLAKGIAFPDFARDWNWWDGANPKNHYLDNFEAWGFERIATSEATQPGDVLLFAFHSKAPHHGALVHDRDLLLHHPAGGRAVDPTRLSAPVPRSRFIRHATAAVCRK